VGDWVAVLLDEVEAVAVDRDDKREVALIDVGVEALRAVGSSNHVLTQGHPRVVVDDARGHLLD